MFGVSNRKMFALAAVFGGAAFLVSGAARAASVSISSNNSSLTFSSVGAVTHWVVDGVDEFGGSPAGGETIDFVDSDDNTVPLTNLTLQSSSVTGNTAQGTFTGMVSGANFSINVKDVLNGGSPGSGDSTIQETIKVTDLGVPPIPANPPLDFLELNETFDANLNATPNDDTLTLNAPSIVGVGSTQAVQTDPAGVKLTWTTAFDTSGFDLISNGVSSSTNLGPSTGNEAFEPDWILSALPGNTLTISNTISLTGPGGSNAAAVPLPNSAAMSLATLAGLGAVAIVRRKKTIV